MLSVGRKGGRDLRETAGGSSGTVLRPRKATRRRVCTLARPQLTACKLQKLLGIAKGVGVGHAVPNVPPNAAVVERCCYGRRVVQPWRAHLAAADAGKTPLRKAQACRRGRLWRDLGAHSVGRNARVIRLADRF